MCVCVFVCVCGFCLVWFGFMAYQSPLVINAKSIFIHINSSILNNSV